MRDINFHRISIEDLGEVKSLLKSDRPEYGMYFRGLNMSDESWVSVISTARQDRYWAIRVDNSLAGLFMLRGVDDGYKSPAYGVYIAEIFSGMGLAKLSLYHAISWCRLNGYSEIILTVHPENNRARLLYEKAGFQFFQEYSAIGHYLLRKMLTSETE